MARLAYRDTILIDSLVATWPIVHVMLCRCVQGGTALNIVPCAILILVLLLMCVWHVTHGERLKGKGEKAEEENVEVLQASEPENNSITSYYHHSKKGTLVGLCIGNFYLYYRRSRYNDIFFDYRLSSKKRLASLGGIFW